MVADPAASKNPAQKQEQIPKSCLVVVPSLLFYASSSGIDVPCCFPFWKPQFKTIWQIGLNGVSDATGKSAGDMGRNILPLLAQINMPQAAYSCRAQKRKPLRDTIGYFHALRILIAFVTDELDGGNVL